MIINLVPQFLDAIAARDPVEGYQRYFTRNRSVLSPYWRNHVIDPDGPHAPEIIRHAVQTQRDDIQALLRRVDIPKIAHETLAQCQDVLRDDCPVDLYLIVGVGSAPTGELVIDGRGAVFVCLEHFTGRPNAQAGGLGLKADILPLRIAHEVAHIVRYTSPATRSCHARILAESGGNYDLWDCASLLSLKEFLVNEGLAGAASLAIAPGFAERRYFGYGARQYGRLRQLEAFQRSVVAEELDMTGLGYRMRYFSRDVTESARTVRGRLLPERSGYYLGYRLVESCIKELGLPAALRASAQECLEADEISRRPTANSQCAKPVRSLANTEGSKQAV